MYIVYLVNTKIKRVLTSFETKKEAQEFCAKHNWEWLDGRGLLWDLEYEKENE